MNIIENRQDIRHRSEVVRGRARAGRTGMEPVWPYGLAESNLDAREAAVGWAIAHHLRWSRDHWCLHWLLTGQCRRAECDFVGRGAGFETLEPLGIHLSSSWLDHVTAWNRGGKPDTLVSQPLDLSDADRAGLEKLGRGHGLDVEINDAGGWHGRDTAWIAITRTGDVSELLDLVHKADRAWAAGDWG